MTWHSIRVDADKVGSAVTRIRSIGGIVTACARCEAKFLITYVVVD
jgi:hypothetical protein